MSTPPVLQQALTSTRRRLMLRSLGRWWIRCCSILLLLLTILFLFIAQHPYGFLLIAAGVILSLLPALALAWWHRPTLVEVGALIDHHLHLQDRVTTFLHLKPDGPLNQAFLDDLNAHTSKLDVRSAFPMSLSRWAIQVPLMILLCLAVLIFWKNAEPDPDPATVPLMISKEEKSKLKEQIAEMKKQVNLIKETKVLPPEDVQEMEKVLKQLGNRVPKDQKEARDMLKDLTAMADRLRKKSKKVEQQQKAFSEQFEQVERLTKKKRREGPAQDMQDALRQGDLDRAEEEARKLSRKMEKEDGLTDEERKLLQEQLEDLKDTLQRMDDEELTKEELKKLVEELKKAKDALQKGNQKQAAAAMKKAGDQIGKVGNKKGRQAIAAQRRILLRMRQALGRGIGKGRRPEAPDESMKHTEEWVRGQREKGELSGMRWIPGMGVKTPFTPKEKQAVIESAGREAAEAMEREYLPERLKDLARGYFENLRQGTPKK